MKEKHLLEYSEYLFSLALKKTNNFEQAEDLVSETLISALISLTENKNKIKNPKAYLSSILNHKFNDYLRIKYSKPTISYGVLPKFDFCSNEKSALDSLIIKEEREKARKNIAQLSKNYRELLVQHFFNGKSIQQLSKEMGINKNTIKSRLNTARMNIKSEMEKEKMEHYEKQSFEPENLGVWVYGEINNDCKAFSINEWTHRLHQNILILAYENPLTITDISKGLGISAAYIEPIVEELINYDFMARIGDKVYTTFIIFNQQDRFKAYDYEKSLAKQYAKKMWEDLECHLERIRQQDFYKRMNKKQQASLIQFAAIFIIQQATAKTFNEKFATKDNFLEINHESGWQGYAYGFREPINYKPNWDYDTGYELCKMNGCHSVSNIKYKDNIKLGFWAYDVASGFTWSQWSPLDDIQFLKVAYAFYSNEKENISLIVPNFFDNELIEKYKKFNFISKDDNSDFKLNIPVLNKNEFKIYIEEIINKSIDDFSNKFKSELEELYINPIKPPKHLTKKIPERIKYHLCADAFVMALIYQGAWNGYYKSHFPIGKEKVPAIVIFEDNIE